MPSFRALLLLASHTQLSFGALPANGDRVESVGWQSDPDGRGTFTLVSSCVLTLTICVYSAMHLNVPPHGESNFQFWLRNIKWGLLGIFGPELVIFIAWKQYLSAKTIVKRSQNQVHARNSILQRGQIEKQTTEPVDGTSICRDPPSPWTLVHGFYAGMGGFTFSLSSLTTNRTTPMVKSDCKRLTLTARGIALLADCELLPDIERKYLDDKSKSDGLSKFIACVQAAWLIVQVIARLSLGLQVTLLETNTLGHVLCALIIYVLWWHKPRMVLEPTKLEGDWVGPLCAYMYMCSRISGQRMDSAGTLQDAAIVPEMSSIAFFPGKRCEHSVSSVKECRNITARQLSSGTLSREEQDFEPTHLSVSDPHADGGSTLNDIAGGSFGPRPTSPDVVNDLHSEVGRTDCLDESQDVGAGRLLRWCLAAKAVRNYPAIQRRFNLIEYKDPVGNPITFLQESQLEELLEENSSNWSTRGLLPGDYGLLMGIALWFASMTFGGIHAAAWNDYFPSEIESWMWRCSAVYIIWSGLVWLLINLVAQMSKPFDDYWNRTRLPHAPFVNSKPLIIVCLFCGFLYTFARMYLVIEAFISIRQLPVAAYLTPDWTQVIPHF